MNDSTDDEKATRSSTELLPDKPPLPWSFGDYRLEEEIGRGAMGVVYRARQLSLDRIVAVKMILAGWLASEEQVERFLIEARTSARLRHPAIVPVHEVGAFQGRHYFTLDFIGGASLRERISDGPLDPREAAELLGQAARAIQYAHEQGVLHRDLKPGNILIDEEGHPWVTDFGLVRGIERDNELTGTGEAIGTPGYMSPEQAVGDVPGIGPGTDVYGLGAVLYTMLAGRPPFVSASAVTTLRLVQEHDPIPLRVLNGSLPRDLETICHKCLQKSIRRRYGSAAEVASDLEAWLEGEPIVARPVGAIGRLLLRARRHPAITALVAAVVLSTLIGGIAVLTQWRRAVDALEAKSRAEAARLETQIEALGTATPDAFAAIVGQLDLDDPVISAGFEDLLLDPTVGDRLRRRATLVLLAESPEHLESVEQQLFQLANDPPELRLTMESLRRSIDGLDETRREDVLRRLATRIESPEVSKEERLIAGVALVCCAPEDPRWLPLSGEIAEHLVGLDPFSLFAMAEVLRPFPLPLLEALGEIFGEEDAHRRHDAARILASRGMHHPDYLAGLLHGADPDQFRILLDALGAEPDVVASQARALLAGNRAPEWDRSEGASRPPLDARTVEKLAAGKGIVTEAFALCPDLGVEEFRIVGEELRSHGYRPLRVRPYRSKAELRVAALFTRDDGDWEVVWDVEGAAVEELFGNGLSPIDIAGYVVEIDGASEDRFVVVGAPAEEAVLEVQVLVGSSGAEFVRMREQLDLRAFRPISCQIAVDRSGEMRTSSVWTREETLPEHYIPYGLALADVEAGPCPGLCSMDVELTLTGGRSFFSGIWTPDPHFESRVVRGDSLDEHLSSAAEVASLGFRPVALSVQHAPGGDERPAISAWHRPVSSQKDRVELGLARSRAAAALLSVGSPEEVWPELEVTTDPGVRTRLIVDLPRLGVAPTLLVRRLAVEADVSIRTALILCLGNYAREQVAPGDREELLARIAELWFSDPDPGVQSACEWFRLTWGIEGGEDPASPSDGVGWHITSEGQRLSILERPGVIRLGSPGWVEERSYAETPHRRLIPRSFAIGTTEVTYGEMRRFFQEVPALDRGLAAASDGTPLESISWYEAVAYCRWLSEEEGLPEEEMCYPPIDEIGPSMELEEGLLERTGYRLPTEAEWEYACRAGSEAFFSFGSDHEMLPFFARCGGGLGVGEVGTRMPNDFGLFDMHGNVMEWCHDRLVAYDITGKRDPLATMPWSEALADYPDRAIRGGWYDGASRSLGSGTRRKAPAGSLSRGVGFRIARTIR